ncbi:MAG: beta-mannosidase [Ruminococcus sp.]|nr:beta-mannosidase [Ruminococcus sp.]
MKKTIRRCAAFISAISVMASAMPVTLQVTAADTVFPFVIEGEKMEGADVWTSIYENQIPDYSGEGFAYLTNGTLSFNVTVSEDGMYQLTVRGAQILNQEGRMQTVTINGVEYSKTIPYYDKWTDIDFGVVRMRAGENEISFINKYGYMAIDQVTVTKAVFPDVTQADSVPCDSDATAETKSLMKYLHSVYGKHIISGQQEIYGSGHTIETTIRYDATNDKCVDSDGKEYEIDRESEAVDKDGNKFYWHCYDGDKKYTYNEQNRNYKYDYYDQEFDYIAELSGEYPAIRGFDFMNYNPLYGWEDGTTERVIDWVKNRNGIATACWHINIPTDFASYEIGEPVDWSKCTYKNGTDFVVANAYKEGTKENEYFDMCIEDLAEQFLILQENGVPLLWRPFHEAEGNGGADGKGAWFWWSQEGAEVYKNLWNYLFDKLTNEYGLHNLIWEQNLYAWSDESAQWYSGDDRVDIVGFDKYDTVYNRHDGLTSGPNYDCNSNVYWGLYNHTKGRKMAAVMENSTIPSVSNITTEQATWLYFCTWYDNGQDNFISGDNYNDASAVKEMYQSDLCITLDELPADLYTSGGTTQQPSTNPTTEPTTVTSGEIVYGDANCDGAVTIADATAIYQAIGNSDKYSLSENGSINADCSNAGDGITAADALAIQKLDAKLISSLPEITE